LSLTPLLTSVNHFEVEKHNRKDYIKWSADSVVTVRIWNGCIPWQSESSSVIVGSSTTSATSFLCFLCLCLQAKTNQSRSS